ncbi:MULTISPECIES: DedA family protein [Hallella]|mgnify:FL=1|uniref:DedA family protein n=1 Tax=Hallella faecis TaxID=2841596 RepID=A0ABV1FSS0_9BACT|nr:MULTISPECIES: DedA family protein [Hallella]MBS7400720.1 DedA family protein [Prevotella sp.]MBU0290591.1 DedA family protein [Hallella faecis]MCI7434320.1 DedA family protein [Prevotella sp.]MDD7146371.1 DedA family protein [Hallella sp.]MDR3845400.1 DedA family protein [Hallella sp.]
MSIISTLLSNLNYGTIFFLMLLESTVIPVPSELVVAPAAYHSAAGNLDIWLVILFSTLGADAGASINYLAGWLLGRPVIWRFADSKLGKLCMLSHEKIEKSEAYFNNHGMVATITGRLIPGIRHLISIPAGLAKMHYWKFMLYTTIGAGAWNCILATMGWYLHTIVPEDQLHDKILEYGEYIKLVIVALVVIAIAYFTIKWFMKRKSNKAQ